MEVARKKAVPISDASRRREAALDVLAKGIEVAAPTSGASRGLAEGELFAAFADQILTPPYDLDRLVEYTEQSAELRGDIAVMAANIEAYGHRLVSRIDLERSGLPKELQAAVIAERSRLENFFAGAAHPLSFTELRMRTRTDYEGPANAYWEVIRNRKGELVGFAQISGAQVRLALEDSGYTKTTIRQLVKSGEDQWEYVDRPLLRRFRRYVQGQIYAGSGPSTRWFKSFGDPRILDNETGEYVTEEKAASWGRDGEPMPESRRASELIHFRPYSSRTPYGVPRWIGAFLAVTGGRAADEVNYFTLRSNCIPSMLVAVSNGQLTQASVNRLTEFSKNHVRGNRNYSTFVVLEGEASVEGEESSQTKVEVTPLTGVQHTDALFQNYKKGCDDQIRRSFRFGGLFLGDVEGLNRATAETIRKLDDEQIFAPERAQFDWVINNLIFPELGILYHRFETLTPNVTDNVELVSMLAAAERTGGITPRISRGIIEDVFGPARDAPKIDASKFDPDVPFSLTMAEHIKNQAIPTEVGQQIAPVQPSGVMKRGAWSSETIQDLLCLGDRASEEIARLMRRRET